MLEYVLDISKELIRVSSFMFKLRKYVVNCSVFVTLSEDGSCILSFSFVLGIWLIYVPASYTS
jgi:hypothetical protein